MAEYEAQEATKPDSSAKPYHEMILDAEKCFKFYQDKCDNIDKLYADLERLSKVSADREFQMFWANLEVVKPSIYSRPPVPVVTPRFKDRKPVPREASSLLERASITNFEQEDIDSTMRLIRDDLATNARGVAWVRYDARQDGDKLIERTPIEHLDRKDFLHDPARKWSEVEWVARGSWLTEKVGVKRFGAVFEDATFEKRKKEETTEYDIESKARVWEIWHKTEGRIIWVSPGVDKLLDAKTPNDLWKVEGFFPCPRPAYGTLQRRTLKPIPDFLYYKDQIEEINELTARISALSEALRLKGFYASGAEDISDAIEMAMKATDQSALLIPVANFASLGAGGLKDSIVWLPVDMVAATIQQLVELRKQLIEDVYQITGLSDIMRGATDANETLGAQQLKSQYGSIRIRDRQNELVRVARDITRISCEIMAENFQPETLKDMSQSDLPSAQDIQQQAMQLQQQMQQLQQQVQQAQQNPQAMQMAQANPEQAQQLVQQAQGQMQQFQGQLQELQNTVTLDAVVALLRDQRLRPFVLDIETDSTIQPDEDAAKQRAAEFTTAVGGFVSQAFPMVQVEPRLAPFVGEMLKFASGPFRAGKEMEGVIDELVEQMKELAGQPKPDPEAGKAEQEMAVKKQEADAKAQERAEAMQMKREEHGFKMEEMAAQREHAALDRQKADEDRQFQRDSENEKRGFEREKHGREMETRDTDMKSKMVEAGFPPDFSIEGMNEMNGKQFEAVMQEMAKGREESAQQTQTLVETVVAAVESFKQAATAPKELVWHNGRPAGVRTMVN